MGKSFKRLATIVGVAALAATGIGLLIPGVVLGSTFVLGSATISLGTLALFGATALSIGAIPGGQIGETGANDRGTAFVDAEAVGAFVFGETTAPSAVIYEEVTGDEPDRVVHDVFAHAWHRIESYVDLYIGGNDGPEQITFSGNAATGGHANALWWFRADGSQVAALSGVPLDSCGWPSDAIFEGVAHSAIVWNVDDDNFVAKFGSVPTKLDVIMEGAWLYDPREDTGAGGSGSQNFVDPDTWTYQNGNAVNVALRMAIGEYAGSRLIWGRGIAEGDYDVANFMAMADVCDETVDSKPRYRLGGMQLLGANHWQEFCQQWEHETGGRISKAGGTYRIWVPHDDLTSLTAITEADLLQNAPVGHDLGSIDRLYNTARGRYIEPTEGYRAFQYPDVIETSAVTDDDGDRILYHDFSWVQDVEIAQRVARYLVRRSRFQRTWTVAMGWKAQSPSYRPFTVHTLNIRETGNNDQLVRVVDRQMAFNGVTILTLQQEDASIYDDSIALGDPFASDTIPTRITSYATITPRYIAHGIGWTEDSQNKPAGIRANFGIANRSQVVLTNGRVRITSSPDTTVSYALPAVPVTGNAVYTITIRWSSSAASPDGLYFWMSERTTSLPAGKTHIGDSGTGEPVVADETSHTNLVGNGPFPGTTVIEETFTYTAPSGVRLVSLGWQFATPATAGVYLEIEWVAMTKAGSNVDLLPGVVSPVTTEALNPNSATSTSQSFAAGPFSKSTSSTSPIASVVTQYSPPAQTIDCTMHVTAEFETELGSIAGAQDSVLNDGTSSSHTLPVYGTSVTPSRQSISYQFAYTANTSVTLTLYWSVTPVGSPATNTATYRNVKWIVEFIKR